MKALSTDQTNQILFYLDFNQSTRENSHSSGEAPKCGWLNINLITSSTKEMGPGSQWDTLDDHFGDWNWKKIVGLGMDKAQEEKEAHVMAFEELDGTLQPGASDPWKLEIEYWEHNPNDSFVTNPFKLKVTHKQTAISQAAVQLKLAEMEAHDLQLGVNISLHPDISPSMFIASGIDLESEQCHLQADMAHLGLHPTDTQKATTQHQQNSLQCKINAWRHIQALYTPAVQLLHSYSSQSSLDPITPEDIKLYLPLTMCVRSMHCDTHLQTTEWELHFSQAGDALEELRQSLHLCDYMYTFKRDWICGQSTNTWAQNAFTHIVSKVSAAADKYCAAHGALLALTPLLQMISWNFKYKELNKKDDMHRMSALTKGAQLRHNLTDHFEKMWIVHLSATAGSPVGKEDEEGTGN
ncbi:uncharacterized protein BJ212DRAFT_1475761 [Suillus subaureus]|uniref:Uncharacterized protein n=1 Tax=Suillus subaureus TaxID=48587 RepID=A0A9P7EKE6_9AGAM|nr:uncharacterized protein BJ212DRAFT_1475761 [Suillus subaureus]KAG1824460.1 hypothetical protein BJ212DRAFT_1475761 [Suillus subaureus]